MKSRSFAYPFLASVITIAVFLPALRHGWVWDDTFLLVDNPHYRGLSWPQLRWMFSSMLAAHYQPLTWLSYALDFQLWGMRPAGYHLTNVVLHSLNAALFFWVARRLLVLAAPTENRAPDAAAFFAALLFALHPLRAETVAWVSERRGVLSGFFYLLTILLYLKAQSEGRRRLLAAAWLSYIGCILSKETGVMLPPVLLVLDWYPLRRFTRPNRRVFVEKIPFFLAAAAIGWLGLAAEIKGNAVWTWGQYGLGPRLAQTAFGLIFYLRKTLAPFNLSPIYEVPPNLNPWQPQYLACAALAVTLSGAAWRLRKNRPAFLAAWLCYGLTLLPLLGLLQYGSQMAADRYSYLSCLAAALLAGAILNQSFRQARALAALVIAFLGVLCWRQNLVWRDSLALWSSAAAAQPASAVAHNNLGLALVSLGRQQEAAAEFEKAVNANPVCVAARGRLVELLSSGRGDYEVSSLKEVLRTNPVCRKAQGNFITARAALGDLSGAEIYYRESLIIDPDDAMARANLIFALKAGAEERARRPER